LFEGKQRDRLMSFKTAVGGISGSIFQLIGGTLAVMSWRYSFIGYFFIVPIIAMIIAWLPEPDVKPAGTSAEGKKGNALKSITAASWLVIILAGIWNFFQFSYFTNISLCIKAAGLGDTGFSGIISSTETLASAVGAICYGAFIKGRLRGFDLPIALLGEAVGFWVLTHIITVPGYYAGAIIYGFFFGMFNPALILQIVKVLPKEGATLGLSLLAAAQNLCQYFSAYVLAFFAGIMGVAATGQFAGWNVAWPLATVMAIVVAIIIIIAKAKRPDLVAGMPVAKDNNAATDNKEDEK
jgi:MFS family permease